MKMTVYNQQMLENVFKDMSNELQKHKRLNIIYEKAHKPKTGAQMGFVFSALISQITTYFKDCGFNLDEDDVKYKLYNDVSKILPEMVIDNVLFNGKPRIKRISEMDRELMSHFINGIFALLDQDPIYDGLKLTPDVHYNWAFHTDDDWLNLSRALPELPERDEEYLNYIRTLPCVICGIQHRSEAHHLKDMNLCGLTQKAPDWATIPLCHHCHLGIAHGTGFKDALGWIPIPLVDFTRICYQRYLNKL